MCAYLEEKGVELVRAGQCCGEQADDVDAALAVAEHVAAGRCDQGLLFCTTGTGATIIANKVPGVRAALYVDTFAARIARLANKGNVLAPKRFCYCCLQKPRNRVAFSSRKTALHAVPVLICEAKPP
ncbi:MAG: RpiB/LacA/LacB family sugar-phosphate isomerase [Acidobacteriaceae bacterium]